MLSPLRDVTCYQHRRVHTYLRFIVNENILTTKGISSEKLIKLLLKQTNTIKIKSINKFRIEKRSSMS